MWRLKKVPLKSGRLVRRVSEIQLISVTRISKFFFYVDPALTISPVLYQWRAVQQRQLRSIKSPLLWDSIRKLRSEFVSGALLV